MLYEAVSGTTLSALLTPHANTAELRTWLQVAQELPYPVLATLCDGDAAIGGAVRAWGPNTPHQRAQVHVLTNLATPVLEHDATLRRQMRAMLGGPLAPPVAEPEGSPPLFADGT